jgi:hypothetical protein
MKVMNTQQNLTKLTSVRHHTTLPACTLALPLALSALASHSSCISWVSFSWQYPSLNSNCNPCVQAEASSDYIASLTALNLEITVLESHARASPTRSSTLTILRMKRLLPMRDNRARIKGNRTRRKLECTGTWQAVHSRTNSMSLPYLPPSIFRSLPYAIGRFKCTWRINSYIHFLGRRRPARVREKGRRTQTRRARMKTAANKATAMDEGTECGGGQNRRLPSRNGVSGLVVNADNSTFTLILFGIANTRGDLHNFLILVYLYTDNTMPANF